MFSFQFDAPKYKCFGGNEPRRSTLTEIDSTNSNDRWFLTFDRPNTWKQLFRKFFDQKQKQKDEHQKLSLNLSSNQSNQNVQSQLPIKKSFISNNNDKQQLKPVALRTKDGHKVILKSIDAKREQENKNKNNQSLTLHQKPIKPSKSQPLLNKSRPKEQKRRNPPCLYPIRIQRQWEQAHNKMWYQLTSQQMIEASKSMKKRMHKTTSLTSRSVKIEQNLQSKNKFTKIKPTHSVNLTGNNIKSVKNPFFGMGQRFKR